MLPILQRFVAAGRLLVRGSLAPFDRIGTIGTASISGKLTEPYRQSLWVQAAIRHIARPIAAVDLDHTSPCGTADRSSRRLRGPAANPEAIEDPRLEAYWRRPAVGFESLEEFLIASVGWRKLTGECFWLLDDTASVPFPEARLAWPQMILADSDHMQHVVNEGKLVGWRYTDPQGRGHTLLPTQVIHLKQWNPYNRFRGLGNYESASLAAEADHASAAFSRNLSLSNGDQGVYVVNKTGIVDDTQRAQIVAALRDKQELQRRGIFRPAFLTGDIEVQDPKIRVVDQSFLDGRRMSAAEIFVAFGVPPSMAKESPSYSIGSASDYYRLIMDTCVPEAAELASGIARVSTLLLGREVCSEFCWDEHPIMQEVRKERLDAADKLWAKGMPLAAISEYLDLDLPRFPGDDTGWLPIGVVPAAQAAEPLPTPAAANEPVDPAAPGTATEPPDAPDAVDLALQALRTRASSPISAADRRAWQAHMRHRAKAVKLYRSAFTRTLFEARSDLLRKIEAMAPKMAQDVSAAIDTPADSRDASQPAAKCGRGHSEGGMETRMGAIDFLFSHASLTKGLIQSFRRVTGTVLEDAGQQVFDELGKDDPFKYPPEKAIEFLQNRENKLKDVAQEVFQEVKEQLQEGLTNGDTIPELSARVRSAFNDVSKERAERIAMTETAAAYGSARQEGMKQAGVKWKKWLTSGAPNVRPAHADAHDQVVAADEPFEVGGEKLMNPGDPAGSPGNVINCHCVAIAVASQEE